MFKKILVALLTLLVGGGTGYVALENLGNGSAPNIQEINIIGTEDAFQTLNDGNNTSTDAFYVGSGFNQVNLQLAVNASSTEVITIEPYLSMDAECADASDATVSWFSLAQTSISGSVITVASASTTVAWTSPVAGEHYVNFGFDNISAQCMKTITYTDNNDDAATVWLQGVLSND